MTILAGTDFTAPSLEAARAARALARRCQQDLLLVHVVEAHSAALPDALAREQSQRAAALLREAAERLGAPDAKTELLVGLPDRELADCAARAKAELIVVGALGRRSPLEWTLGSTADRMARGSRIPVLVARSAQAFEAWERGQRPLRVLLALDLSSSADAAVRWTAGLAAHGPCTVIAAHVYWPVEVREKLHLPRPRGPEGGIPIGSGHPDVERALEGEFAARLAPLAGAVTTRLVGGLGRVADHLVQIAEEERADLVVVGNRQRSGLPRLWHGSVSHGVLDLSQTSVACVPA
jgi:nucleotide-binding universal stress UspA family protein